MIGRTISHFEMPPNSARQPDRLVRFLQEARAASALNPPDGSKIAYLVNERGKLSIHVMLLKGTGESLDLCEDCGGQPIGWTPDGIGSVRRSGREGNR
jgi:hypothetical protein